MSLSYYLDVVKLKIIIILFLIFVILLSLSGAFALEQKPSQDKQIAKRETIYSYGFEIRQHCIRVPLSKYLLIRYKNGEYGAIKFLSAESITNDESIYEWWFGIDTNGKFTNKNSKKGIGQASDKALPISGRFALQLGNPRIKFGSIKLSWNGPTWVCFYDNNNRVPVAELAPTDESEIKNISVFDPKIKWYQMDPFLVNYKL